MTPATNRLANRLVPLARDGAGIDRRALVVSEGDDVGEDASGGIARGRSRRHDGKAGEVSREGVRLDPRPIESMLRYMNMDTNHFSAWLGVLIPILILIALWDGVWKVIGMWKSARHNQLAWFVCLALFNTMGILPIVYLAFCQKDRNKAQPSQPAVAG